MVLQEVSITPISTFLGGILCTLGLFGVIGIVLLFFGYPAFRV